MMDLFDRAKTMIAWCLAGVIYMVTSALILERFSPTHNIVVVPVVVVPSFVMFVIGTVKGPR